MIARVKNCAHCHFCDTHWGWYCTMHSQLLTTEVDLHKQCELFKEHIRKNAKNKEPKPQRPYELYRQLQYLEH